MSSPDASAAERLAEATRQVIDRVRRSAAPAEVMDEATRLIEQARGLLDPHAVSGPFMARDLEWTGEFKGIEHDDHLQDFLPYSPFFGLRNPLSPPILMEALDEGRLLGRVTFGAAYVGPPTSVHGGMVAAAFDELLGACNVVNEVGGMTGTLTVRYLAPTPAERPIEIEAWVDRIEGRKVFTHGEMRHEGRVTAEAVGVFIQGATDRLREALASGDAA